MTADADEERGHFHGQRHGPRPQRQHQGDTGRERHRPRRRRTQRTHRGDGPGGGEDHGGQSQATVRGGQRGRHLVATHRGAARAAVVQPRKPRRHQRETRQYPQDHDGHQRGERSRTRLLDGCIPTRLEREDRLPTHAASGERGRTGQPAPAQRCEPAEQQQPHRHSPGNPCQTCRRGPCIRVGECPGTQHAQHGAGDDQRAGHALVPGSPEQRTDDAPRVRRGRGAPHSSSGRRTPVGTAGRRPAPTPPWHRRPRPGGLGDPTATHAGPDPRRPRRSRRGSLAPRGRPPSAPGAARRRRQPAPTPRWRPSPAHCRRW